jgi:hypothetical protein
MTMIIRRFYEWPSTLEIEPLKDMDANKLRAGGLEVSKI